MHDPLKQFEIKPLYEIDLLGFNVSFTNSSLFMMLALLSSTLLLFFSARSKSSIPTRFQVVGEMIYELVLGMLSGTVGKEGKRYLPFVFSLFIFILFCNLVGMIPYSFTVTSHIIVTFALAGFVFIFITALGFIKHGMHYLSLLVPEGTPWVIAPLMVIIELFSYLSRPISLSVRLAANMSAGHIVLKLLASFTIMGGMLVGPFPFAFLTILQGFEIFVAVLQAYIFSILTCVYLNDAINLH